MTAGVRVDTTAVDRALARVQASMPLVTDRATDTVKAMLADEAPGRLGRVDSWRDDQRRPTTRVLRSLKPFAGFVARGVGRFGPRRRDIRPVRARALRIELPDGEVIFRTRVQGFEPNPYHERAAQRASLEADRHAARELERVYAGQLGGRR